MGMMNNCWFRVRLNPTVDSRGRLVLRAQHPTQPANRVGGWMGDNPVDPTAAQAAAPAKEEAKGLPVYTAEEVEKHSAEDDCWLIYKGEVYDVTSYIHEHPGGADSITMLAGTDCTDEFDSIHSKTAREIFAKYKIGRLGTAAEKSAAPAAKAAAPAGKGGDDAEGTVHVQREGGGPVRGLLRLLGGLGGRKEGSDREIEREGSEEAPSREVSVAEERVEEDLVVLQGRGKVDLPLVHREDLNHNTRLYRFGLPSAAHRLGLPVGKHVFLSAMIDGKLVMRAYTPKTNDLVRGHVDFVIKTYFAGQHPKFPEGGKMTQHLEKLSIGDTVSFRGPLGEFEYLGRGEYVHKGVRGRARRLNMVGGGTGITPCWQVLEAALRDPEDPTEVALLYANQTEEDILLREELEALAERHPGRFRLHYTVDRAPEGWTHSVGFVSQEMLAAQLHPKEDGTLVLMCGPPPMINFACKPNLEALGFSDSDYVIF